ncbi:hypothetical protein DFJ68_2010 [Terracoccus luteus]|uniref:Uncharacterized protein n=1 Tax=Terracoccus luteus TaxID=53356 RepID=A0A495Y1C8_9MICO|nr:hypothetical protein DFJ68_2010 [Terracoccus luteus]
MLSTLLLNLASNETVTTVITVIGNIWSWNPR